MVGDPYASDDKNTLGDRVTCLWNSRPRSGEPLKACDLVEGCPDPPPTSMAAAAENLLEGQPEMAFETS